MSTGRGERAAAALLLLAWLSSCATTSGTEPSSTQTIADEGPLPIPADLQEPLARSMGVGRQLYTFDKAAAIGTDTLMPHVEDPTRGPNGEVPEGLFVTHVVTDYPLETHVFTSLLIRMPVLVATSRGVWHVAGDEITLVKHGPP
ncbi:MAG: hypothetical protein OXT09_13805 [Myxococcales bacterium]|nr:hypothetical protein [Myxococcales bacterium]